MSFLLVPVLAEAKVYLVSVGISDYPGTANDLRLPVNDAKSIVWVYAKNREVQYIRLLDSQATAGRITAAMDRLFTKAGKDDVVVFFYSGHGYPGGFYVYDGYFDYGRIRRAMAKSGCRRKMIFADACFSGKIRTSGREGDAEVNAMKKSGVLLFLSSRSGEYSCENPAMKNGYFTSCLQKGLRGGADRNRDRIITARELFDYVHRKVVVISNNEQHPVMWGNFPDDMPVMTWK